MKKCNEDIDFQYIAGGPPQELQFYTNSISLTEYIIPLDEGIVDPSYYRSVFRMLEEATENDTVRIIINNGGGDLMTALHFATLIRRCEAYVIAQLMCECHSAASVIALACDDFEVAPWAHMLVHNAEYGIGRAKAPDIEQQVAFSKKQLIRVLKEVYSGFLTAPEISKVVKGEQLYFDNEEIVKKLDKLKGWRVAEFVKTQQEEEPSE